MNSSPPGDRTEVKLYRVTIFTKRTDELVSRWLTPQEAVEAVSDAIEAGEDRIQVESSSDWNKEPETDIPSEP